MRMILLNKNADLIDDQSIISRVQSLLDDAIAHRASDIHLEPTRDELRVRFRIDGILIDQKSFSVSGTDSLIPHPKCCFFESTPPSLTL